MSFKYFVAGFVGNQGTHTPRNIEVAIITPPHVNDGAGRALHSFRDIKEVEKMIGEHDGHQFSLSFSPFLFEDSQKGIPYEEPDSITVRLEY